MTMSRIADQEALKLARARIQLGSGNSAPSRTASRRNGPPNAFAAADPALLIVAADLKLRRLFLRMAAAAFHAEEIAQAIGAAARSEVTDVAGEEARRFALSHRHLSAGRSDGRRFAERFSETVTALETILEHRLAGEDGPDGHMQECFDAALGHNSLETDP